MTIIIKQTNDCKSTHEIPYNAFLSANVITDQNIVAKKFDIKV